MKHDHYVASESDNGGDENHHHDEVASHYAVLKRDNYDNFVASQTK